MLKILLDTLKWSDDDILLRTCYEFAQCGTSEKWISPASVICTAAVSEEHLFHFAFLIKLTCSFGRGAPSASAIIALSSGSRWAIITSSFVHLIYSSLDISSLLSHLSCSFLSPNTHFPFYQISLFCLLFILFSFHYLSFYLTLFFTFLFPFSNSFLRAPFCKIQAHWLFVPTQATFSVLLQ